MNKQTTRFNDGAAYERMMGVWSRLAGNIFLDWLAPRPGLRWIDVGCGNGAFTELLVERCAPSEVQGIDPSDAQIAFARTRPAARLAQFQLGDALALPFPDERFDAAVMALVIFFVPDPARGVAEMVRVVAPGGTVSAYAWNMFDGGFPLDAFRVELSAMASPFRRSRVPRLAGPRFSSICGQPQGLRRSRPARSRCSGPSPTLRISGTAAAPRTSATCWPR
jgi:SAM-dependent methyltransferase